MDVITPVCAGLADRLPSHAFEPPESATRDATAHGHGESLPYPFGPDLQHCHVGDHDVDFLWLLPITEKERAYKVAHGQEALKVRFDEIGLRYRDLDRASAA